jgi:hypothetical protein
MSAWSERVEELLYDGESIESEYPVDTASVYVTSHRVLVFTPDGDGENFRQVDRPNVGGVSLQGGGETKFRGMGIRAAVYGLFLVAAGLLLPIDSVIGDVGMPTETGQLGIGGVLGLMQSMLDLLRSLDDLLQIFGALLLAFALVPLGVYLWSRERYLAIETAGDAGPIRVPAPEAEADALAAELEREIVPAGVRSSDDGRLSSLLS